MLQSWVLKILILALTVIHLLGCAERYRDADAGRTAKEVEELFRKDLGAGVSAQGGGQASALEMINDPNTSLYFAESYVETPGAKPPMGPVEAVAPVDYPQLNMTVGLSEIKNIRVYFLDQYREGRHNHSFAIYIEGQNKLLLAVTNDKNGNQPESSVDDDGIFQVRFTTTNGTLLLESDDTTDGELQNVIQLRLSLEDSGGTHTIGQISSMVGFLGD